MSVALKFPYTSTTKVLTDRRHQRAQFESLLGSPLNKERFIEQEREQDKDEEMEGEGRDVWGHSQSQPHLQSQSPALLSRRPGLQTLHEHLTANLYSLCTTAPSTRLLLSCGHCDCSFRITSLVSGALLRFIVHHKDIVTCIDHAADLGKHWVATGSRDCTVSLWRIHPDQPNPLNLIDGEEPVYTVYSHSAALTCVVVRPELDLLVSAAEDGVVVVTSLRDGSFIRSIPAGFIMESTTGIEPGAAWSTPARERIHLMAVSAEGGVLVVYSRDGHVLSSYTVHGRLLARRRVKEVLHALLISEDGRAVVTGGERGLVVLRWMHSLRLADNEEREGLPAVFDGGNHLNDHHRMPPISCAIRSLAWAPQEKVLLVGLESGTVRQLSLVFGASP